MNIAHDHTSKTGEKHGSSNRAFGLVFTVFLLVVGIWPMVHGLGFRLWALVGSGALLFLSLLLPVVLTIPNRIWTRFGLLLHSVTSPIALGILFYGMFTPMGLIMRLFGKDSLRLQFETNAKSYWIRRKPPGPAADSLLDQF